jgi:hypothetical protein
MPGLSSSAGFGIASSTRAWRVARRKTGAMRAPRDAARLFEFAEPALPQGWHSVYSGGASEKTLVVIRK